MNSRLLQVLRIRPFLYLWLAEVFSQVAMNVVNFALIIIVFKITNSNTAVSGIVLSFVVPAIFLGVFAGVMVDRLNKKNVLLVTNLFRTVCMLGLAFAHTDLILIYALSFAVAVATQFFIPAETPMIPILVKKDLLLSANALFGMGIYGSILVAYALSGSLLLFFGETTVFFVLAVLFLLAAVFVWLIRIRIPIAREEDTDSSSQQFSFVEESKSVIRLIIKTGEVSHALFLLTVSQVLTLILAVVGPGYAREILGVDINQFPLLFVTPAALGMAVGAVLLAHVGHKYPRNHATTIGVFLSGIGVMLLPYGSKVASRGFVQILNTYLPHTLDITIIHIMVVLAFILGFANALVFVPANTTLQEETSDALRGRVYGSLNALVGLFSLLPIVIVGGLADIFGVATVLVWIGGMIMAIGIFRIMYSVKK